MWPGVVGMLETANDIWFRHFSFIQVFNTTSTVIRDEIIFEKLHHLFSPNEGFHIVKMMFWAFTVIDRIAEDRKGVRERGGTKRRKGLRVGHEPGILR